MSAPISEQEEFEFRLRQEQEAEGSTVTAKVEESVGPEQAMANRAAEAAGIPKGGVLNRGIAGAREFIRSIGTGEDAADSYMRGFNNPGSSETLQSGAIRGANETMDKMGVGKLPLGAQTVARFAGGLVPSAAGLATDIATNPGELLSIAMLERFPTLLKQTAPGLAARISEFANKERKLGLPKFGSLQKPPIKGEGSINEMIKQASQEFVDMAKQLKLSKQAEFAKIRQDDTLINNGFNTKIATLDNEVIPKAADKSTTTLRNKYWDYAKDLSNRFGAAWEKAIAGEKIQTQKLYDALQSAIDKDGFMVRQQNPEKWSSSQKAIYDYQQKIGKQLPSVSDTTQVVMTPQGPQRMAVNTGQETLDLSKVDKDLQNILGVKKGTQYTSNDHILSLTREETANAIGESSKRVSAVRHQFAPEYQAKNELTKIVQPFNRAGEFDTTKGINFFSDYASGKMTDPDQLRLIDHIVDSKKLGGDILEPLNEASIERNSYLMNKAKLAMEKPGKFEAVNSKYQNAGQALVQDHQNHLAMLDAMKQVAVADENKTDLIRKLVIGGTIEEATIGVGRKIIKALSGK